MGQLDLCQNTLLGLQALLVVELETGLLGSFRVCMGSVQHAPLPKMPKQPE